MGDRPNILWFCTDHQRYDTIGTLGNPHIRTPRLDRLAAEGTAFRRAYAQSTVCTPSRPSFLTGRYPAATRVLRNGAAAFPADEILVTRMLADAVNSDCHKNHVVCEYNDSLGTTPVAGPSHGTTVCDGRWKTAVYHGTDLGEVYDLERARHEFDNLWNDPALAGLKPDLLRRHLDAVAATHDAGLPRPSAY